MDIERILTAVTESAPAGMDIFLVGGGIRDRLMGRDVHDLDFILRGNTYLLARRVADRLEGGFFVLDRERGTTRVVLRGEDGRRLTLDFAEIRLATLEEDLASRDFTVNAMAVALREPERIIDPCEGAMDLREKRLRACRSTSVLDDPVRALRAVRLAVSLGFHIERETLNQVREATKLIRRISSERIRDEWVRIVEGRQTSLVVRLMERTGLLEVLFPELQALRGVQQPPPHIWDVWEHTLACVDRLESLLEALAGEFREDSAQGLTLASAVLWLGRYRQNLREHLDDPLPNDRHLIGLLKMAALFHDAGKPLTAAIDGEGRLRFLGHEMQSAAIGKERARALVYSNLEVDRLNVILREHMRVHSLVNTGELPTRRAIYRFFRDTGPAGVDICLLSLADLWAIYGHTLPQDRWLAELRTCRALMEARWEKNEEMVSPPRLVTGRDLIEAFKLVPGRVVGDLLETIREAQATGQVATREEALELAQSVLLRQKGGENDSTQDGSTVC